ncbi:hypothetical protein SAMN05421827_101568 [Pedobacter terrae]|uniref:Uncharacterized protein n=1 Tax=Pedobacter terrae TaxID=405671 RepID=A0A1G7P1K2_9SPHI|nr:hypothetical protein [Pedobacter terrae]SDF79300.1 hypothetical protein SAMN05421827_101568 [Pedobacter terrae]
MKKVTLKLSLDALREEMTLIDQSDLSMLKGGTGNYGAYNSWEDMYAAMQNGYVPPAGSYSPGGGNNGGYGGYGQYGGYGGYTNWWEDPNYFGGSGSGGYGSYGGYGGYSSTNATPYGNCVFDTLTYLSGIYGGTQYSQEHWLNYYRSQNSDNMINRNSQGVMTGVTTSTDIMLNLMSNYFSVQSVAPSNLNATLTSGKRVLANLANQGPDGEGHSIIINCRNGDGTYEIYDPTAKVTRNVTGGDLAGTNYLIAI